VQGSVSDLADLDRLYAAVKVERRTLDVVFANAGAGSQLRLGEITAEHCDEILDTNVKGRDGLHGPEGAAADGSGRFDHPDQIERRHHGLPSLQSLRRKQGGRAQPRADMGRGPKGHRHWVNVLSPGPTATELAKESLGEEGMKAFASLNPLQRMADTAEIGAVATFLTSQDSSFMTASEVAVDGGLAQI